MFDQYLNVFQSFNEVIFGIKLIALVMLYGYVHMNLGGGMFSTVAFLVFAYFMLFSMGGLPSIVILVLFYLMIHGFDIIWGGDIVKQNIAERQGMFGGEMAALEHMRPPP